MASITVDREICKGCGLCVKACPKGILALDPQHFNQKGYAPAVCTDQAVCTGCAACGRMCPDCAITVER